MGFVLALAGEAGSRQREEVMGAQGTAVPGSQHELPDLTLWLHSLPGSARRPCLGDTGSVSGAALL